MNYKNNPINVFYYFSFIMMKILNWDYQDDENMLYYS